MAIKSLLPRIKTKLPGPKAKQVLAGDRKFVSPSYTRPYPLVMKRGRGAMVEDVDGNTFLDFSAGIAVCSTGHAHPEIVAAIQKQAADFIHMSGTDFYYPQMVELAQKLADSVPGKAPRKVYFGNSGAEAIEAAMKVARFHTKRDKFIAFYGAFHGRTFGALSLTASRVTQRRGFSPLVPGVTHIPYGYCYRCPYNLTPQTCSIDCGTFLRDVVFKTTVPPEEVAAIFVEPILGEGGYVIPPVEFLQELKSICEDYGILFVADEVQSGMGRTGKMWAIEHFGIEPDILCTAKGLASGMPIGVMIARSDLMNWPPGAHASTFGGNPVSCAAALATIKLLEEQYTENAARIGKYILEKISDWPRTHPLVGEVRGLGLMVAIELVRDKNTRVKAHEERDQVLQEAFKRGLLILGCGENVVRLMPPLLIDQRQADVAVEILEEVLTRTERR
ncbi:MAG: acetyl ornithine aminotransferase family protein [Acidobacteriia bacterium]|nr:acetyl ornithine aminotransferase family protein [Terriglobia bacterium]